MQSIELKKQNIIITFSDLCQNISKVYELAEGNQGEDWYFETNAIAQSWSEKYNVSLSKVCAIISACSINSGWNQNLKNAELFLDTGKIRGLGVIQRKCDAIMANEPISKVLSTDKLNNFYWNIYKPDLADHVTIDRHATAIAYFGRRETRFPKPTAKRYNIIAEAYKSVAENLGLIPQQLQAITWVAYRNKANLSYLG